MGLAVYNVRGYPFVILNEEPVAAIALDCLSFLQRPDVCALVAPYGSDVSADYVRIFLGKAGVEFLISLWGDDWNNNAKRLQERIPRCQGIVHFDDTHSAEFPFETVFDHPGFLVKLDRTVDPFFVNPDMIFGRLLKLVPGEGGL